MKDDRVYLEHIMEASEKILTYTSEGRERFLDSSLIQDAVMRNLAIIGEATKNLHEDTRSRRPDVPWRRIAGLRDVLVHDYMGVDPEEVWNVIESHLPFLRDAVEDLLSE